MDCRSRIHRPGLRGVGSNERETSWCAVAQRWAISTQLASVCPKNGRLPVFEGPTRVADVAKMFI